MLRIISKKLNKNKMLRVTRYTLRKRGFTLAEVVVAMGIFSIASLVISAVYLNANNLHQHTVSFQRLQNEGRYIMEKMVREIRGREIDYTTVAIFQPQDHIDFLGDEADMVVSVLYDSDSSSLVYTVDGVSANLNAEDIEVVNVKFYVVPSVASEWGSDPVTNSQPRVTIFLKIKNKAFNPEFEREILLQTTVSSKVYKR